MTETTHDDQAPEHQTRKALAVVAAVSVLCLLGIMVVQRVRRFLDSVARSRVEPGQLDHLTGGPLHPRAEGWPGRPDTLAHLRTGRVARCANRPNAGGQ